MRYETRAVYPRAFALRASYDAPRYDAVDAIEIENRETDRTLPASFGFHPAFAWPLPYGQPREDHRIVIRRRRGGDDPQALRRRPGRSRQDRVRRRSMVARWR